MAETLQVEPQNEPVAEPTPEPTPSVAPPEPAETPPAPNGSDETLGDGGGGDDSPQVVPATWPDDWRQRFAGTDEEALKTLKRFKDPGGLWKSYKSIRSKVSGGELLPAKPDAGDEAAMTAWRTQAGVPETAEGYLEGLPEGVEVRDEDKAYVDGYFKRMHESGVGAKDAHEGLKAYYEVQVEELERQHELDRENRQNAEDDLRSEWGPEYRANLNAMHSLFDAHAPEGLRESLFAARMADGTPLGDHPDVLRFLVGMGLELNPGGTVAPVAGKTQMESVQQELTQLRKEMSDTKSKEHDYWANPGKQARFRELTEIEEKMKGRAA